MKILINRCYGGFSVTEDVYKELGIPWDDYGFIELERNDPRLIAAVEKVGLKESSGEVACLEIVDIPDGIEYEIDDYDGVEVVHEKHRSWP